MLSPQTELLHRIRRSVMANLSFGLQHAPCSKKFSYLIDEDHISVEELRLILRIKKFPQTGDTDA
jgi:hypothetical protein